MNPFTREKGWSKMNAVLIFIDFVTGTRRANGFTRPSGASGQCGM